MSSEAKKRADRAYYYRNRERKQAEARARYHANREAILAQKSEYMTTPEYKERRAQWEAENMPRLAAIAAAKRARRKKATPQWLTDEHKAEMLEIYETCPRGYHVDHIVPLAAKEACGLHVPWNLQHLPAAENQRKKNRLEED